MAVRGTRWWSGRTSARRRRLAAALALVLVVASAIAWWHHVETSYDRIRSDSLGAHHVGLDSTLLVPHGVDADHPAPAVLVAHGLGDGQEDVAGTARALAHAGYVVLSWTSRGQRGSTGRVGIAAPDGEVADVSALVDQLARRRDVQRDRAGDPRVGIVGVSQGGGVALLAAARDHRIDAVVPVFAWYDLRAALEPDAARRTLGAEPGVLKLRWGSELFAAGSGGARRAAPCGNVEDDACTAWTGSAQRGQLTPAARSLLATRSPAEVVADIEAPTLVVQGQMDSLFDLTQGADLARALRREHVPTRVEWMRGGHDLPLDERRRAHLDGAVLRWFDHFLRDRGDVPVGPRFTVQLGAGRGYANAPDIPPEATSRHVHVEPVDRTDRSGSVRFSAPAAGLPADATSLPGLGDVTALSTGFTAPRGQRARFESAPVDGGIEIIGTPRIRLAFSGDHRDGIAFVHLVDIASDGRRIVPRGLVSALRLSDLPALGAPGRAYDVALPPIAWRLAPGHRLGVEVSSTDAGYVAPAEPATFAVRPVGRLGLRIPEVRSPERSDDTFEAGRDPRLLLAAAAALVLLATLAGLLVARAAGRRDRRVQEPALRDVPIRAQGLAKRFGDGRVAVDGVTFRVDPGTVVGLVGPNGAGKTTVLRMLLGLVHPTDGTAHVFGQRVRPGVPNLARIGALVEGPGLVPHLTGRAHLQRYWSATGRSARDAGVDAALAAVGLTADAERTVRTWSQGMRQRLAIAQALLGRPDLVLLDEPTNGLDPAQVIELRELVRAIASEGRSVLLSSHQLDELERVCTHVVLVAEGRVLASGTLDEVRADHGSLEAAFLARVEEGGTHA
ncbi:MAG: CocE/NonD family hydrolase [Thermoleophilia bacterium]|nr:CocE/NonD family hydrolase [Thermoleophilia bacterium]